ncbi:MAG: hypothetical protein B6U89_00245 [Desulfurococcales archaeon ex4484_58]|nr:MAG: hypothetical protein B6U89_00245 [Desulfurococcales archaeon ex4484_58]
MVRVPNGSYIIEPYKLLIHRYIEFLRFLEDKGLKDLRIVSYPSYFLGRVYGRAVNTPQYYGVSYYSFILLDIPEDLIGELSRGFPELDIYVVVRDAWIDCTSVNLEEYINKLSSIMDVLNKCLDGEINVNGYRVVYKCLNGEIVCRELIVLDHVNAPYQWVYSRKSFNDNIYRKALRDSIKYKPMVHVLSYICGLEGEIKPLVIFKPSNRLVEINVLKNCYSLREYIVWLITDLFLG